MFFVPGRLFEAKENHGRVPVSLGVYFTPGGWMTLSFVLSVGERGDALGSRGGLPNPPALGGAACRALNPHKTE